jgi:hypothetical protein
MEARLGSVLISTPDGGGQLHAAAALRQGKRPTEYVARWAPELVWKVT